MWIEEEKKLTEAEQKKIIKQEEHKKEVRTSAEICVELSTRENEEVGAIVSYLRLKEFIHGWIDIEEDDRKVICKAIDEIVADEMNHKKIISTIIEKISGIKANKD